MTKTAKWSMIGVLAALVLALFAVAGCSSDNAGNNDNGGDNANPATAVSNTHLTLPTICSV